MRTVKSVHKDYFKLRENVKIIGGSRNALSRSPLHESPIKYAGSDRKPMAPLNFWEMFTNKYDGKGLLVPTSVPVFSPETIKSMGKMGYDEISFIILDQFIRGCITDKEFAEILEGFETYRTFEVPVTRLGDSNTWMLDLTKGPSAAFKDFAALLMKAVLKYHVEKTGEKLTFILATSGDTGGAFAQAFRGIEGVHVIILFPKYGVTERQRRYMTTPGGNVKAYAVDGDFDACIALVRRVFGDKDLAFLNPNAANSLNFTRIIAQTVYYFYARAQLLEKYGVGLDEPLVFSVPTGNGGNITAGLYAKMMGLFTARLIAAVNKNDTFHRFLLTGAYDPDARAVRTLSNSMDIVKPVNLARIIYNYGGSMTVNGNVELGAERIAFLERIFMDFASKRTSDDETGGAILLVLRKYGIMLDPHGAVGFSGLEHYREASGYEGSGIFIKTAAPAKFCREMKGILGYEPQPLDKMKEMEKLPEQYEIISNNYDALKGRLLEMKGQ